MNQQSLWQPSDIMSAETGTEPDAPKKRGRIPQSAWPGILERYRAGQTLSAIAREFDCTPSAISYIVRKAEAVGSDMTVAEVKEETGSVPTEASRPVPPAEAKPPQPEAAPSEPPAASSVAVEPRTPETRVRLTRPAEPSRERIGPAKPAMPSAAPPAAE
ncbi:MAG TPA: hypothetical protein VEB64_09065, partial [Azospirillaceae bacterium]|nr:hypothetical protein [Azospirillaceae bacterium]